MGTTERNLEERGDEIVIEDTEDRIGGTKDRSGATAGTSEGEERADTTGGQGESPLLPPEDMDQARARWQSVQGSFVDEPRSAVKEADQLVADLMGKLTDSFARERDRLEGQWSQGDEVSTEELRIALQRYRVFFERLLAA
jgi:hypothetical protein